MSLILLPTHPKVAVKIRRSARAKQITLRVSSIDGRVSITAPSRVPLLDIEDFILKKESWVRQKISEVPEQVDVNFYTVIPIRGVLSIIVPSFGKGFKISANKLYLPHKIKKPKASTLAFLRVLARDQIVKEADFYAEKLDSRYASISLRDTKSRWGSCNGLGAIMFSWRLIMAPPKVLSYVVAHEVAHLRHMNHSDAFWTELHGLFGDFHAQRDWLDKNGATLHKYKFKD